MIKKRPRVLAPLNPAFTRKVARLASDGRDLARSYADLTERMVRFAEQFYAVWQEAKSLDRTRNGRHHEHLRGEIAKAVGTTRQDVWSKWNTIGSRAHELLEYKSSLPPQRESLYEVALALGEKKPVDRWVEQNQLTTMSTVRDVSALRKGKKRTRHKKSFQASVTLEFQTYDDATAVLLQLPWGDDTFRVKSHKAFSEALKAKLDVDGYEKAKTNID